MKRHKFDPFSLVLGIFVAGLGLTFLFDSTLPNLDGGWVLAAGLVLLGAATLAKALRPS